MGRNTAVGCYVGRPAGRELSFFTYSAYLLRRAKALHSRRKPARAQQPARVRIPPRRSPLGPSNGGLASYRLEALHTPHNTRQPGRIWAVELELTKF